MTERNNHGGSRDGAGRKPRATRYATMVAAGEAALVGLLPKAVDVLRGALERGDIGAAKMVLTFCLGRPAAQGLPLSEDHRLPQDHPAADELARMRNSRDLSVKLATPTTKEEEGLELLNTRIFVTDLVNSAEEKGDLGLLEAIQRAQHRAQEDLDRKRGRLSPEKTTPAPLPARVVQLLPRLDELGKKKKLTGAEKKELVTIANEVRPYLEAAE